MRAGPQLRVDAYASVAAFGHESLQAASRDTHFAHFCEGRTGPSLHPPHPGASANLTAQPWPYKYGRGIRLNRLWPTLPFSRRIIVILKLFDYLSRFV